MESAGEDANTLGAAPADGNTTPMGAASGTTTTPASSMTPLPAEVETTFEFELPHAGDRYVYAVNTERDNVAVIDASTLAIHTIEAGDAPRYLQTLAGTDAAVVLNVASGDATIIRSANGKSTTTTVDVQEGTNAIAVAPDGKHAVVFFDSTHSGAGVSGSYQDINVLFLEQGEERAVGMTVGFRPSAVKFSSDGKRAFVVTEDGVSILDFADIDENGAQIARNVPLGDDATESLDVSVTPDGNYALARREGESLLRLVDLENGDLHLLDLSELIAEYRPEAPVTPPPAPADAGVVDSGAASDAAVADASEPVTDADASFVDAGSLLDAALDAGPTSNGANDAGELDAGVAPAPGQLEQTQPSSSSGFGALPEASAPITTGDAVPTTSITVPGPTATAQGTSTPAPTMSMVATAVPVPVALPPSAVTDLDLAPSGTFAVAVVRDLSLVLQLDVPGAFTGGSEVRTVQLDDQLVGSVTITPNSEQALLYTTVVATALRINVLDIDSGETKPYRLPKGVQSVAIADDSKTAFIVHQKEAGDPDQAGIDADTVLARSYGYSVFELATGFSKLQTAKAPVGPSTLVPDGSNLFVLFDGATEREVHRVNLTSFIVDHIALGSPPTSVGSVPRSKRVFVGQDHPDGRIAFIDWETGDLESVTGFELNSRIRE